MNYNSEMWSCVVINDRWWCIYTPKGSFKMATCWNSSLVDVISQTQHSADPPPPRGR